MKAVSGLVVLAATALLVPAASAIAQVPRACTPAELSGTKTPVVVDEDRPDGNERKILIVGKKYAIRVIPELAISRDQGRSTRLRENSLRVAGPAGLTLSEGDDADSGRHSFRFTAPSRTGTLHFDITWILELDPFARTPDACSASAGLDLPVVAPLPVSTRARLVPSDVRGDIAGFQMSFVLPAIEGVGTAESRLRDPVTVLIRLRYGTVRPPQPRGRATFTLTYRVVSDGQGLSVRRQAPGFLAPIGSNLDWDSSGVTIYANPNIPRSGKRFAISVEARQAGKRVGGMRGGAFCRSKRYTRNDGARRTTVFCKRYGFAAKP